MKREPPNRTPRAVHRPDDDDHWFVRKRFGFGATPVTWQGWLSTALYIAIVALAAWGLPSDTLRISVIAPITVLFIAFVATRTKDDFGWRWGGD